MNLNRSIVAILAVILTITPLYQTLAAAGAKPTSQTIAEIASSNENFEILSYALARASLADALNSNRQYTVFAPTDTAFMTLLGKDTQVEAIEEIGALNIDVLKDILLYHVLNGRRTSQSVVSAPQYRMLNGSVLSREDLVASGLSATDISARNGVIHVIDSVLLP